MEAVHDGNLSGSDVGNHLRNEEGAELRTILPMGSIIAYLILEGLDTTDTNTIDNTNAVLVLCLQVHTAVLDGLLGGNEGQLCVAVHLAGFLAVDIFVDIQVLDLTGKLCLELRCIEKGNRCSTALASQHVLPSLLGRVAQWRNGTHTSYYYSF